MSPAARERRAVAIPILGMSALAWGALALRSDGGLMGSCCVPTSVANAFTPESIRMLLARNPVGVMGFSWAVMILAMMAPMLATPIGHVLHRSFRGRRFRSVALFLLGYSVLWMAAGAVILAVSLILKLLFVNPLAPVMTVGLVAALWQFSPAKQTSLNRKHALPELSAFSWKADGSALGFGLSHGFWCVGSCWALMWFAESFSVGHLLAMVGVMVWQCGEHLERPRLPKWKFRGVGKLCKVIGKAPTYFRVRVLDRALRPAA